MHPSEAAAVMPTKLDLTLVRITVGVMLYVAMLVFVTIAGYALLAGPQTLGVSEAWPLVFYFVVPYFATLLVGFGGVAAFRYGPWLVRQLL
jgi:hypothetical protein